MQKETFIVEKPTEQLGYGQTSPAQQSQALTSTKQQRMSDQANYSPESGVDISLGKRTSAQAKQVNLMKHNQQEGLSDSCSEEDEDSRSDDQPANEEQTFVCPHAGCEKTFSRKIRLNAHMHLHYGTQPFKCPFPGCNKAFSEKQNLKIHIRIHKDERPFPCPQNCGKSFRTKGNMRDHERRHFGEKPFKCDKCGTHYYRKNVLKAHMTKCIVVKRAKKDPEFSPMPHRKQMAQHAFQRDEHKIIQNLPDFQLSMKPSQNTVENTPFVKMKPVVQPQPITPATQAQFATIELPQNSPKEKQKSVTQYLLSQQQQIQPVQSTQTMPKIATSDCPQISPGFFGPEGQPVQQIMEALPDAAAMGQMAVPANFMQEIHNALMTQQQAPEAILSQLLNQNTSSAGQQLAKIVLLKRVIINILGGILNNGGQKTGTESTKLPSLATLFSSQGAPAGMPTPQLVQPYQQQVQPQLMQTAQGLTWAPMAVSQLPAVQNGTFLNQNLGYAQMAQQPLANVQNAGNVLQNHLLRMQLLGFNQMQRTPASQSTQFLSTDQQSPPNQFQK